MKNYKTFTMYVTCGTSILTNACKTDPDVSEVLKRNSNKKTEGEINPSDKRIIDELYLKQMDIWGNKTEDEVEKSSAELKCFLFWIKKNKVSKEKISIILLHTDTVFGDYTSELIKEWLEKYGCIVLENKRIQNLNAERIGDFEKGLSELALWTFSSTKEHQSESNNVIFNVAGGFKSVSGFMQMVGQVCADEIVYIYEGEDSEVLSIPKLPFEWNDTKAIEEHFDDYRRLSLELPAKNPVELNYLWVSGDSLSPWGVIVWEAAKKKIYKQKLFPSVYNGVILGADLEGSVQKGYDYSDVNERIDDLVRYLQSCRKINPGLLHYRAIAGKHDCTHECNVNGNVSTERLFCIEQNGKIIVQKIGDALHKTRQTT